MFLDNAMFLDAITVDTDPGRAVDATFLDPLHR
jgi:hypothetical protein